MTHRELIDDLADHLDNGKNVVFREPCLGSRLHRGGVVPVPDLFVFAKSYTKTNVRAFEVKASRSDLQSDVRQGKFAKYLPYCDRMFFAIGPGVEWQDLLAGQPCGVMVRGPKAWKTVRHSPVNPSRSDLSEEVMLSLIFSHLDGMNRRNTRLAKMEAERELFLKKELKDIYYAANKDIEQKLDKLRDLERITEHRMKEARREAFREIANALGADGNWLNWGDPLEKTLEEVLLKPMRDLVKEAYGKLVRFPEKEEAA